MALHGRLAEAKGGEKATFLEAHRVEACDDDEAATKLLYLAIRDAGMRWKRPVAWTAAMGQFAILFEDRFPASVR